MYSHELIKGHLVTIVLSILKENGRMYGYEIFQMVKEQSNGKIELKDGSLYPALQRMSKDGLIEGEEVFIGKRKRKYYTLTSDGENNQKKRVEELREFIHTITPIVSPNTSLA